MTDSTSDIKAIREWLAKESYLPQELDDFVIKKFLHSCYGSLEKTKKCIERFSITRSNMPEVYTNRDPVSKPVQAAFDITSVATYEADGKEILIHQLDDPTLENMVFYDLLKSFSIQADFWIKDHNVFPDGHTIIFDIKDFSLKIIPKVNIMFFRDFLLYLLEGMPVRVTEVHVINCPSYYDKLYALVKPVLPAEICDIINFHPNVESLHKKINKKYLPVEYGGDAQSMKEQQQEWLEKIEKDRKFFLDDHIWKADLSKKPKGKGAETMNGSFRKLAID